MKIDKRYTSARRKLLNFSISVFTCTLALGSGFSVADDTDVFFALAVDSDETRPNVMFILDTSQSMNRTDSFTDTRLDRLKTAMQQFIASDVDMNVGFMQFNGSNSGGPVLFPLSILGDHAEELSSIIDDLRPVGGTPTVDTYYEAARYFRGEGVDYGKQRGAPTVVASNRKRFRVSHKDSYTGGQVVRSSLCTDANLSASACSDEYISGNPVYISPVTGSCQANHIVILSDGLVSSNSSAAKIRNLTGDSTCSAQGDAECATELAEWLDENDQSDTYADVQNITTHTIAFNLDGDGKDFLQSIADANEGGGAYEADTAEELITVFKQIATEVADVNASFTAPAASVNQFNRLTHNDDIYFSLFKPEISAKWDGNIKRFRIGLDNNDAGDIAVRDLNGTPAVDEDTGLIKESARSWWAERTDVGLPLPTPDGNTVARGGAANQLMLDGIDGIGARRVYTWVGNSNSSFATPVELTESAQHLHEDNELLTDGVLGIAGVMPGGTEQTAYRSSLLQWARGVDVLDSDEDGLTGDVRRQMGDPMHSTPITVNYSSGSDSDDVQTILYVSTNEGYLHAFDTSNGEEQFAFVPYELLPNLNTFYADSSGVTRPYGLDGPITLWRDDSDDDMIIEGDDSAYLFVGMRRGGNSYYALDVTDPDAPKLAWTIKGGPGGTQGFETMGQSWSRLSPVSMFINGAPQNVLVFGGGYDVNQDPGEEGEPRTHAADSVGNGIYIVKAETGELLWSGLGATGGNKRFDDMDYGFNAPVRAIDINRDSYVDQLYAADAGGQLWRFDISQLHGGSGDLVDGGVIAKLSGGAAKDHRRFYNEPDVALIDSGDKPYLSVSIGSGWRANPLDEIVDDRFYMIRQYSVYQAPESYGKSADDSSAITESDLINVTSTANPITNEYGWFLELGNNGEKALGTSTTFDGKVIFSTYLPAEQIEVCAPEIGSALAYVLDVASGAPVFDLDGSDNGANGDLTIGDRNIGIKRGGIPPEATILITEGSMDNPVVLFGTEKLEIDINNQMRRTAWADQGESGDLVELEEE